MKTLMVLLRRYGISSVVLHLFANNCWYIWRYGSYVVICSQIILSRNHSENFIPLYVLDAILYCLQVFEALGALKFPYIYPDPESRRLRAALAKDSGLEAEYLLVGCGADELIDLIMRWEMDFYVLVYHSKSKPFMHISLWFSISFVEDVCLILVTRLWTALQRSQCMNLMPQ